MKTKIVLLVLLMAGSLLPGAAHAQGLQPVVVLSDWDLWLVDGTSLTNLTRSGHVMEAALSPDGTRIAYVVWSPISVEAVERSGGLGGGPLPADVAVLDLATLQSTIIAVQPADASFITENVPDSALLRSGVTWSPDGTRVAWGEVHYPSFAPETNRLVIFDLNRHETTVLVTHLPEQAGVPSPVNPRWGGAGIAAASYEYDPATSTFYARILVYSDQDGHLLSATRTSEDEESRFNDFLWVNGGGKDWILIQYSPSRSMFGELLDPLTGAVSLALAKPELVNPLVPDSAAITFDYDPYAEWPQFYSWTLTYAGGQQVAGANRISAVTRVTLGPDGQAMAQVSIDGLLTILWPDAHVTEGPVLTDAFANLYWGPAAWRIFVPATCGTALPARLYAGGTGMVSLATTPNNVRSEAATGTVIGQLQPGEDFQVLAGPVCAGGMNWWQIDNYGGLVGWTAESDSTTYWLDPTIG